MPQITLHHLDQSRSLRVLWLLEELGLEYQVKAYTRDPRSFRAPRELREIHPLGKAPVLEIDGTVFAESAAMFEEVLDQFGEGRLRPEPGSEGYRDYRYWLHYAEGSLMSPLLVKLIASRVINAPVPFFLKPVVRRIGGQIDRGYSDPELALHGGYLAEHLTANSWFLGDAFSAIDILMSYPLEAGAERGAFGERPALSAWLDRVRARDGYVRAKARSGE